jgi:hypothetical protein
MGLPILHKKVKLIVGFIFNNEAILSRAESLISKKFGPIDLQSHIIDFSHTGYYEKELGKKLKRKFISLKELISIENIFRVKLLTNDIECKLARFDKRTINIDPGYITEGKLVLLTTKDREHRIYLNKGIYAESTLKFYKGTYLPWSTTYPDYRTENYIKIFNAIRNLYKSQLNKTS